jgi:hypothetical protein
MNAKKSKISPSESVMQTAVVLRLHFLHIETNVCCHSWGSCFFPLRPYPMLHNKSLFVLQCALCHILVFILNSFVYFLRKSVFCHCKLPMHNLSFCPSPLLTFSHLEMVLLATESPMPSHLSPNTKDCCSPYSATMPQSAHAISLPSSHLLMTLM